MHAKNAAGKNKRIADLTEHGKRLRHKACCQSQSKLRDRQRVIAQLEKDAQDILSPPVLPLHVQASVEVNPHDFAASTQKQCCRKKIKKNRSKACRTVYKLQIALKKKMTARYKKHLQRLIVKISPDIPSPVKKTSVLLGDVKTGHKSWKRVLFYQVLVSELKKKLAVEDSEQEKQIIMKICMSNYVVKKYKVMNLTRTELGISWKCMATTVRKKKLTTYERRPHRNAYVRTLKQKVCNFMESEDISRITTPVRDTITRKEAAAASH